VICAGLGVHSTLKETGDRKRQLVKILVPNFLYATALDFADKIESKLIKKFEKKRKLYFNYILQK